MKFLNFKRRKGLPSKSYSLSVEKLDTSYCVKKSNVPKKISSHNTQPASECRPEAKRCISIKVGSVFYNETNV